MNNYLMLICLLLVASTVIFIIASVLRFKTIRNLSDGVTNIYQLITTKSSTTNTFDISNCMKLEDLLDIVKMVIGFNISHQIQLNAYETLTHQELSIKMEDILQDVCTTTILQLSPQIKTQLEMYLSRDYINNFIVDYARNAFIIGVESRRVPTIHKKINANGK